MLAPHVQAEGIEETSYYCSIGTVLGGSATNPAHILACYNVYSKETAIEVFKQTGLSWGPNYEEDDNEVYGILYIHKPIRFDNGSLAFYFDTVPTREANKIVMPKGMVLMVKGDEVDQDVNPGAAAIANVNVADTSDVKLFIANAKRGHTYLIFSGSGASAASLARVFTNNKLLTLTKTDDTSNYAVIAEVDRENPLIKDAVLPTIVTAMVDAEDDETTPTSELLNNLFSNNATIESAQNAISSLANFSELAGSTHGTYTTALLTSDLAQDHLSIAHHTKVMKKDLWAVYSHSNESVDGLTLTKQKADYEGSYHSYVIGSDLYEKDNFVLGVAGSYSTGKISSRHNAVSTKNEAKYYGASIYGRKINGKTSYLADLSYLHGSNDITQRNTGEVITGKPKTDAISLGIKAEQEFTTAHGSFIPYAGVRYMHLSQGDYKTSAGFSYEQDDQNLFLIPMGVKFTTERKAGDWHVKPMAEVGLVINTGDKDTKATISDGTNVDALDYTIVNGTSLVGKLGVQAERENLTLGVSYRYQKSSDTSDNRFQLNFGYKF